VGEQSFDVKGCFERLGMIRRGDDPPAILIGMTDYRFTLEPVLVGEPWWETGAGKAGLIAAAAILLSLLLWLIIRRRRRERKNGKVPPESARVEPTPERIEALYLALKTTSHGKLAVLGSLARLIGFLRNAVALGGWNERTRERMALNVLTLRRSGVPQIREIADQVRAMRLDDGLEERLREGIAALDGALALLDETKKGAEEPRVPLGKLVRAEELLGGEDGALPALRWRLVRDYLTLPLRGEVELVFDSLRENLEEAGIALDRPAPEEIAAIRVEAFAGDAAFVLENLIGNAIRAMESSGRKELRVAVRADEEDVYIEVADTGAGIPEEDWERIFEPGYTTRGSGGGHGLGESREKLRRVGGSIRVARSAPGEGTMFAVRLKRIGNGKGGPE